jgi:hypothetical protein
MQRIPNGRRRRLQTTAPAAAVEVKVSNAQPKKGKARPVAPKKKPTARAARSRAIAVPRAGKLQCPLFSPVPVLSFPVKYRYQTTITAGRTKILVLAPWSDVLGRVYEQAASPPDGVTAVTTSDIIDPYLTSLFTNVSTSGAGNYLAGRWTNFCVEMLCKSAVGDVSQSALMLKWTQSGVPVASSGSIAEFQSTWTSMGEHVGLKEYPLAQLMATKCIATGMFDRTALEMTPMRTGAADWASTYGNTSYTTSVGSVIPWTPIVIAITAPAGAVSPVMQFNIEGRVEVNPSLNNFLCRIAKTPPAPAPGQEERWMAHQRDLINSDITYKPGRQNRDPAGVLGLM